MDQDYVDFDGYDGYDREFEENRYEDYELPFVTDDSNNSYADEYEWEDEGYAYDEDPAYLDADCYA